MTTGQPNQPEQSVSPLTQDDRNWLQEQRAAIESRFIKSPEVAQVFATTEGKLTLIHEVLKHESYTADHADELQQLGVILGDAFVQEFGMEWIVYEDEGGRDLALNVPESSVTLFPITTILKRILANEEFDVFGYFNAVAAHLDEIINEAD